MGGILGGFGSTWNVGRVMAQSMGGGVSSELTGGSFQDGFKVALVTAAASYAYSSVTNYDSTLKSGDEYSKSDWKNYNYDEKLRLTPKVGNTIGFNDRLTGDNWYSLENIGKQGGLISRIANKIPGMNSFSKLHDQLFVGKYLTQNTFTNIPSMVPVLAVNYASIYSQNYAAFEIGQDIEGQYK